MTVFLNGRFLPAGEACIPVNDRGFLYGDGLFETVRSHAGRLFRWPAHARRLGRGLALLGIKEPLPTPELEGRACELLHHNGQSEAVVRLAVSRGPGPRGYSPRNATQPTLLITTHPAAPLDGPPPSPARLHTCSLRVPAADPLAAVKASSRLLNVLAFAEAERAGADEALLLNVHGHLAEAASSNLFWFDGPTLRTPSLGAGALEGVTRGLVLELARGWGWPCSEEPAALPGSLARATGVFLTSSGLGPREASELDGRPLPRDPRWNRLLEGYRMAVRSETQG